MKREKAYLVDLNPSGFRNSKPAEIIGVEIISPDELSPRLCYHVQWGDFVEDWKPVKEGDYKILTLKEVVAGDYI